MGPWLLGLCAGCHVAPVVRSLPAEEIGAEASASERASSGHPEHDVLAPSAAGEPRASADFVLQALGPSDGPRLLVPGTHLAVLTERPGAAVLFDLETGDVRARRVFPHRSYATVSRLVGVSASGRFAWVYEKPFGYYATEDSFLHVWDLARDELRSLPLVGGGSYAATSIVGSRNGSHVVVAECERPDVLGRYGGGDPVDPDTPGAVRADAGTPRGIVTVFDVFDDTRFSLRLPTCDALGDVVPVPGTHSVLFSQVPGHDAALQRVRGAVPDIGPARWFLWDTHAPEPRAIDGGVPAFLRAVRPTTGQVVLSSGDGTTNVVSPSAPTPSIQLFAASAGTVPTVGFGSSGSCLFVHDPTAGTFSIHDADTLEIRARFEVGAGEVAVDADCSTVALLDHERELSVFVAPFDARPTRVHVGAPGVPHAHGVEVTHPSITDDGRLVLLWAYEGPVVFDRSDGWLHVPGAQLTPLLPRQVLWSSRSDALLVRGDRAAFALSALGVTRYACEYSLGALALEGGGFGLLGEDADARRTRARRIDGVPVDSCHVASSLGDLPPTERIVALDGTGTSAVVATARGLSVHTASGGLREVALGRAPPFDDRELADVRVALSPGGQVAHVTSDRGAGLIDLASARYRPITSCEGRADAAVASADGRWFHQACDGYVLAIPVRGGRPSRIAVDASLRLWGGRNGTYAMDSLDGRVVRIRRLVGTQALVVFERILPEEVQVPVLDRTLSDASGVPEVILLRPSRGEPLVLDTHIPALLTFRGDALALLRDADGTASHVVACRAGILQRFDASGEGLPLASYGSCDARSDVSISPDRTRILVVRSSDLEVRAVSDGRLLLRVTAAWGREGSIEILAIDGTGRAETVGAHFARRETGDAREAALVPVAAGTPGAPGFVGAFGPR